MAALTPTARALARYQATMEKTLRSRGAILRSGEDFDCRLEDSGKAVVVPGLPRMMRLRQMKIFLKGIDDDVHPGDSVSVVDPGDSDRPLGTYFVMDVGTPRTNARWTEVYGIMTTDTRGRTAFPTTETVTIKCSVDESLVIEDLPVLIYPAATEEVQTPASIKYKWGIWIPRGLTYPNTTQLVSTGDAVIWSELERPQALAEKRPLLNPLPATQFYFEADSSVTRR